jgi:DNA helicase-2/ATP-dependent DNA helicase PcrA
MSLEEPGRLEEERRLCYVGITRARQRLTLSHAETRRLYGNETYPHPSRFISEIPSELLREVRLGGSVSEPVSQYYAAEESPSGMRLGQRVFHAKFGDGVVLNLEGQGAQARVQVNFDGLGSKWLMMAYANLEAV